ncbi:MAG: hypothetical protein ACM3PF_01210 [Bacteroidota bacterium]
MGKHPSLPDRSTRDAVRIVAALSVAAGVGLRPAPARATLPATAQTAVQIYCAELDRVERAPSRVSLERLFSLAYGLRDALVQPASAGGSSPLEDLSDEEFAAAEKRLRGMVVGREEGVFAVPDPAFFEQLGERKGSTEDRLLLRLYHRTYPVSIFPAYVRQQTDEGGCTDFGAGKLTALYGEWSHYRALHPDKYAAVVNGELERITDELTRSTCACGPSGSVQSEFRYFMHRHPGSPLVPAVRARLEELLHGTGPIRFNCTSG